MGLISVPVFIRVIGLDQYGRFSVIVPFLMAVAGASSGWLAQGILRFHPGATDPPDSLLTFDRAVKGATVASVLVTSVVLAAVLAGLHYPLPTLLVSLAFCLALIVYALTLSKFQAQLWPGLVLRREVVRSVGGFVFPLVLIALTGRKQFELVVLGQAIAYTIAFLPSYRWRNPADEIAAGAVGSLRPDSSSTGGMIRQLWKFGWAVGLWLLLSQLLPVIDRWTIQRFAGFASAGIYASLYEIAIRSFSFLVFPVTQAAHPRIMRSWNEGQFAASYRIIRSSLLSQLIIFAAVLVAVFFLSHRITTLILGFDDPIAAPMLSVLLVGGFLWQLALLLHKPLEIAQRTDAMLAAMAIVVVLNVIACFAFIPRFGYEAASYILVFSACSYIALTLGMTRFRALRRFSEAAETY
jgi:O-antigen/teichoic acid export membrane protein